MEEQRRHSKPEGRNFARASRLRASLPFGTIQLDGVPAGSFPGMAGVYRNTRKRATAAALGIATSGLARGQPVLGGAR